jgi:uncharacterized repeat protein (TIGR03987 family)
MKPILIVGSTIVTLALIAYTIGIVIEQKKRILLWSMLLFFGLGLFLDISGTACMIVGSNHGPFTIHGIIGYTALIGMFIDNLLLWRNTSKSGINTQIVNSIHIYSRVAYLWWVLVYASGLIRSMHM